MSVELRDLNYPKDKPVTLTHIASGIHYLKEREMLHLLVRINIPEIYKGEEYTGVRYAKKLAIFVGVVNPKGGMEYGYVRADMIQLPQVVLSNGVLSHKHESRKGDMCSVSISDTAKELVSRSDREPVEIGAILAQIAKSVESYHGKNMNALQVKSHKLFVSPHSQSKKDPTQQYVAIRIPIDKKSSGVKDDKGKPVATVNSEVDIPIFRVVKTAAGFKTEPFTVNGKKLNYGNIHEHVNWGATISGIFSLNILVSGLGFSFYYQMRNMILKTGKSSQADVNMLLSDIDMSAFADDLPEDDADTSASDLPTATGDQPGAGDKTAASTESDAQVAAATNLVSADDDDFAL